jgi:hypothetical protein
MNRNKASLYFAEYRRGTLDAGTASKLRQLLESDATLRADYEADTRIEELVGLKRHEMPASGPFTSDDAFIAEFHRRQRLELVKPEPVLVRIQNVIQGCFVAPTSTLLRYSGVAALLAIVVGLSLSYSPNHAVSRTEANLAPVSDSPIANVSVVLARNLADTPVHQVLQRVNTSTGDHGSTRIDF